MNFISLINDLKKIYTYYRKKLFTIISDVDENLEFFGWIFWKIEFIYNKGIVRNYLKKWRKKGNFDKDIIEILTKSMRDKYFELQ